jgi:hypothetical protein
MPKPHTTPTHQEENPKELEVQAANHKHLAQRHVARRDHERDQSESPLQRPHQRHHANKEDEPKE